MSNKYTLEQFGYSKEEISGMDDKQLRRTLSFMETELEDRQFLASEETNPYLIENHASHRDYMDSIISSGEVRLPAGGIKMPEPIFSDEYQRDYKKDLTGGAEMTDNPKNLAPDVLEEIRNSKPLDGIEKVASYLKSGEQIRSSGYSKETLEQAEKDMIKWANGRSEAISELKAGIKEGVFISPSGVFSLDLLDYMKEKLQKEAKEVMKLPLDQRRDYYEGVRKNQGEKAVSIIVNEVKKQRQKAQGMEM